LRTGTDPTSTATSDVVADMDLARAFHADERASTRAAHRAEAARAAHRPRRRVSLRL